MDDPFKIFQNFYVIMYLAIVISLQLGYSAWRKRQRNKIAQRRRAQGLPDTMIMSTAETLTQRKREAFFESTILLLMLIVVPFVLIGIGLGMLEDKGLAVVFGGLLIWVLLNGTDVAKAFLGGLAFKTLVAYKTPFQVGDRVTFKGIGGKVIGFDTFFVTLQTLNDDQISIPTTALWSEVINSANAGDRSSLCVMNFYLAPFVSAQQRQAAEDAIWEAIQASPFFTPSKPMQIYLSQNPDSIQLTAKAYVASTYNEPLFTSDVTRAFLDFASEKGIALAARAWRTNVDVPQPAAEKSA